MAQPTWISEPGSLGTIPEGIFYNVHLSAIDPDFPDDVTKISYVLISGSLPSGIAVTQYGYIAGVPVPNADTVGVPSSVSANITNEFTIRATSITSGRVHDRTFSLTITGQDTPVFTTPSGIAATFFDGDYVDYQFGVFDADVTDILSTTLVKGDLPPGLTLSSDARLTGYLLPNTYDPNATLTFYTEPNLDLDGGIYHPIDPFDSVITTVDSSTYYPYVTLDFTSLTSANPVSTPVNVPVTTVQDLTFLDAPVELYSDPNPIQLPQQTLIGNIFYPEIASNEINTTVAGEVYYPTPAIPSYANALSQSTVYTFTLAVTDTKETTIREFTIQVLSRNEMTSDSTILTSDMMLITADSIANRTPYINNFTSELGKHRHNNFFAYQIEGVNLDAVTNINSIRYTIVNGSLPDGLQLNIDTGWIYGDIGNIGLTEQTFEFGVELESVITNTRSKIYDYTITIVGEIETNITWVTTTDLGIIDNGETSTLSINAISAENSNLQYRIKQGTDSKLPQGLQLLTSGNIVGNVSFNTFSLDSGTTTFDAEYNTRLDINTKETTFDFNL